MADFNWVQFFVGVVVTSLAISYGRWSQRRDDRKKREREIIRRAAQAMAQQTLRGPGRGA